MAEEEKKVEKVEKVEGTKPQEKKKENEKRPKPLKRILQSNKRNLKNREMKSKVRTAIKDLYSAIDKKEAKENVSKKLNLIFALSDKAAKMHAFKKNKADRIKSKAAIKLSKASLV